MTEDGQPQRHAALEELCGQLESILWGRAAGALLAAGLPAGQWDVILLPVWDWRLPAMEIGRKGLDHDSGDALLMPVRLDWGGNDALLRLADQAGPPPSYRWTAHSMGWDDEGELQWNSSRSGSHQGGRDGIVISGNKSAPGIRRRTVEDLDELVRAGRQSQWQLLFSLEPFVTSTVRKAHSAVSHEIGELTGRFQSVLHDTGIEQIVNVMMVGEPTAGGIDAPSVPRLLEQCLRHDRFTKVDPLMFLRRNLRRDAEDQVRRAIGDPRVGPKVRRIARQMPGATLEEIVAAYRLEHPQDKLSTARAEAALQVGSDPMARSVALDPETNRGAR
ncbi:MAG: hypothetical protein QJR09_03095 [Micrococcus sp.]|nr:hypothetical protein [Micrococcus sp.]